MAAALKLFHCGTGRAGFAQGTEKWIAPPSRDAKCGAEGALILTSSKGLLDPPLE
jgi:hypothetical protein